MAKKKIGIMGGTFDPIHTGHLALAENVREALGLQEVLFIPAAQPPHKGGRAWAAAEQRYAMTLLATAAHPCFHVSRCELERKGPSYSYDTVRLLREEGGADIDLYFLTGSDEINSLAQWYRAEDLLRMACFVVTPRPGIVVDREGLRKSFGALTEKIIEVRTPYFEISSTDIRERLRAHRTIRYLVPPAVEEYIAKEGLYR